MGIPVVYSPDSLEDLENIRSYMAASLGITGKILRGIDSLSDSPELGPRISARFGILTDYRYLVIGKYLVVYRYTRKDVRVIRVFNG
ncbi:MAG: type II toxin-antitoxin system RelE/ParE family toxin, partial [Spirochaetales bacterium]|nr:type II toxin-antitoxin system RelE/ParE family toxin [Spirochaetales bacterium]